MALTEILGASVFLIGYPTAGEVPVIEPVEVIADVNDVNNEAVLPKILRIANFEIYWVEQ